MTYPKLPDGPSGPGSAAVRGLGGVTFQRKVGADYTAHIKDGYSRVTLGQRDLYLTTGLNTTALPGGVPRGANNFRAKFHSASVAVNRLDSTGYYELTSMRTSFVSTTAVQAAAYSDTYKLTQTATFAPTKSVSFEAWYSTAYYQVSGYNVQRYAALAYFGTSVNGRRLGCVTMRDSGAVDVYGNKLLTPYITYVYSDLTTSVSSLSIAAGTRYYTPVSKAPIVCKSAVYLVIPEVFFYKVSAGATTTPSAPPPIWLLRSPDAGFNWNTPVNMAPYFPRANGIVPSLTSQGMFEQYAVTLTNDHGNSVFAVCGDDAFVMARQFTTITGDHSTGDVYPELVRVSAGTVTPLSLTTDTTMHGVITALVYVGQNCLIAVYEHLTGSSDTIDFWSSTDLGSTWTQNAPNGFNCTVNHAFVGSNHLFVDQAATATTRGTVLITAWDQTVGAYFVYATKDLGATWVRKGQITAAINPATHDAVYGTGGYQYDQLGILCGAASPRKLDPALPTRYA